MKTIYLLLFLACFTNAQQEIHCKHFFYGYPLGTPLTNDLIIRDIYALSSNDETKFADWVAYRLTMHEVDGNLDLDREWRNDPWLEENETLEAKPKNRDDYTNAASLGYDRGHQAPLGSFKGSRYASETNYYSNITPQMADLNQGAWQRLEEKVRAVVRTGRTAYIMTGPLYETAMPTLPNADEEHTVPSGYWKIITIVDYDGSFNTASFIFNQNTARNARIMDHITNIDVIESRSGLNFFWMMEDAEEDEIESEINQQWAQEYFE
jgi:endonuclease G, mitochondrial